MKNFLHDIPVWFRILFVLSIVIGIGVTIYTFNECGAKTLFLGSGGLYAVYTGMCE